MVYGCMGPQYSASTFFEGGLGRGGDSVVAP